MKYIHYFETSAEYTQAKASVTDSEPWVSYCARYNTLTYSPVFSAEYVANGYEFVDLGLPSGTLWATCNVGAYSPEQSGGYYAWGETETKSGVYGWSAYKFGGSASGNQTKYNATDGLVELELEDDAAHVNMGGAWRMPTLDEFNELKNNSELDKNSSLNGVSGTLFTSTINGNSIFFPYCGIIAHNASSISQTTSCRVWTSNISYSLANNSYTYNSGSFMNIRQDTGSSSNSEYRTCGYSIRGVFKASRQWYNPLVL